MFRDDFEKPRSSSDKRPVNDLSIYDDVTDYKPSANRTDNGRHSEKSSSRNADSSSRGSRNYFDNPSTSDDKESGLITCKLHGFIVYVFSSSLNKQINYVFLVC